MQTIKYLKQSVEEGIKYVQSFPDVQEAEVAAFSNTQSVVRVNYTSHIPCNGVEEPKSKEDYGISVRVALKTSDGIKIGFGSEANNCSLDGVRIALEKARDGAVSDLEFVSLPDPSAVNHERTLFNYHDQAVMDLSDKEFVRAGWRILNGAIEKFQCSQVLKEFVVRKNLSAVSDLGLIVGGDLTIIAERAAICSTHMPEAMVDESTIITATLTAMVEKCVSKGTGYGMYSRLFDLDDWVGREAVQNAIDGCGIMTDEGLQEPVGIPSGAYDIVFGSEPVSDMLNNLVLPGLTASAFYEGESPFMGMMGRLIASPEINLYDDAVNPKYVAAKGMTCEGIPTKRTDLIQNGVLSDLLSNWYETNRLLRDGNAKEKLGMHPFRLFAEGKLQPASGFRFGTGGGRRYDSTPGIAGTTTILTGTDPKPVEELIGMVKDGLYVGRIWYCYPMNGLAAGDFTTTVIADSYVIKKGKITAPLKANAIRINDNILRVFRDIKGVSDRNRGSILWAADEVPYAPDVLVRNVPVEEIGAGGAMTAGG